MQLTENFYSFNFNIEHCFFFTSFKMKVRKYVQDIVKENFFQ